MRDKTSIAGDALASRLSDSAMNDVRNLMSRLSGELDYKEFEGSTPVKSAGAWALLERARSVADMAADEIVPAQAEEPKLATDLRKAADARSQRGLGAAGRLSLGQYATPEPAPQPARAAGLPLSEVFARLCQGA